MKQISHRELPEWMQREADLHRHQHRARAWRRILVALVGFWIVVTAVAWKMCSSS